MVTRFVDPFAEIDRLMSRFDSPGSGIMPIDAFEKEGTYVLRFDLPGVDPDQVDVTVEDNMLTVTAERLPEDTEGATWLIRERPHGRHSRQLRLGRMLDTGGVEADYEHGVLTVTIPLREEAKPRKVSVASTEKKVLEAASS